MSPIRFFLSATLGIHLLSDCTSPESAFSKRDLLLNWVFRMREAHGDLYFIRHRGDNFDNDYAMALQGLQSASTLASGFLDPDIRLLTETVLHDFETLFKQWCTTNNDTFSRVDIPTSSANTNAASEQQLRRQHAEFLVGQAHIQHVYDMPEVALELLSNFHTITRGFNRILDKKDIYIDVDQVSEFVTCAIDGLVEQMNIEYQLPERAEQLLQSRVQLLIVEIRLATPMFAQVHTGWLNADEILLVVAGKLEASLRTRKLLAKPTLTLVGK